jgi:hypothetical protein
MSRTEWLLNTSVKDFMRDELHQLREDVFTLIHMY